MRITKKMKNDAIRANFNLIGLYSLSDIVRKHHGHFFDADTMRFFKTRLVQDLYATPNGAYFITNDLNRFNNQRYYCVRYYTASQDQISVTFETFETLSKAKTYCLDRAYRETIV